MNLVKKILKEHRVYSVDLNSSSYGETRGEREAARVVNPLDANVVSSEMVSPTAMHRVMLDLDLPCELAPSSTPGHFHLYIDKMLPWEAYEGLLDALKAAGILEPGYVEVSKDRRATFLRVPWVRKDPVAGLAKEVS